MKMSTLQIKFDADKLTALTQYAQRKEVSVEDEMRDALNKLYEKFVPAAVREYIDINSAAENVKPSKPPKPAVLPGSGGKQETTP